MKSLTTEQSQTLSKLIDAKWDSDHLESYHERDIARQNYYNLKRQLVESMGLDEWIEFMNTGAKMFAPAQS
jgi:Leu/Phe-tRNA-protein transferase